MQYLEQTLRPAGLENWFRRRCDEAGLKHGSAHGLRKAGATIAAGNGATEFELMAIFGWASSKEAARYDGQAHSGNDVIPYCQRNPWCGKSHLSRCDKITSYNFLHYKVILSYPVLGETLPENWLGTDALRCSVALIEISHGCPVKFLT